MRFRIGAAILATILTTIALLAGNAPVAHAKVGNVHVRVVSGGKLRAGCDWNSAYYYVLNNGDDSYYLCTADNHDTDWAKDTDSKRCVYIIGVGAAAKKRQGAYWIAKNQKMKVTDATNVFVYKYSKKQCGKRKYVNPH